MSDEDTSTNVVQIYAPTEEQRLPLDSWSSIEDVIAFLKENESVKNRVVKSIPKSSINIGETMKNLMTVSSTIKLAVAASHGFKCNTQIILMLSRFQTLVKDCSMVINIFLNTSIEVISLYQEIYKMAVANELEDIPTILDEMVALISPMADEADRLVKESSALVVIGETALLTATKDRFQTTEERKKAEAAIISLNARKKQFEDQKSELRLKVVEAEQQEQKAMKEASKERRRQHELNILKAVVELPRAIGEGVGSVVGGVTGRVGVSSVVGGVTGRVGGYVSAASPNIQPAIEAKTKELMEEEAKLLSEQDDEETAKINKRIGELKQELNAVQVNLKQEPNAVRDNLKQEPKTTQVEQPAGSSLSSVDQRELMLTKLRIELQKLELQACAELSESVAKLESTHYTRNELEQAVASLDVAVKSLGEIKTVLEKTSIFWKDNSRVAKQVLTDAQTVNNKLSANMLFRKISRQAYLWMALGQRNYEAMEAIEEANSSVDEGMNNLPTTKEAWDSIAPHLAVVKKNIENETNRIKEQHEPNQSNDEGEEE